MSPSTVTSDSTPSGLGDLPDPYSIPIEDLDPSDSRLFETQQHLAYFERLRAESPVHLTENESFGRFWSVCKFEDIVYVDSHHDLFSSEPEIVIGDGLADFKTPMFIAMDKPKHDEQRKAVSPAVAPVQLSEWESLIRGRVQVVLDSLPIGESFNWVDKVSIELTTQMLATLFDFPFDQREKLTYWSDVATSTPSVGSYLRSDEERVEILTECLRCFQGLIAEKAAQAPKMDFISLLAHDPKTAQMEPQELLGNIILLIVGGNDTTRNSMSGGVYALNKFPSEFEKLKQDPSLIPNMVSEIIRWQTPLAHMRRVATQDTELKGSKIKKGDKVVMWYVSGNRDDEVIEDPNTLIIDRKRARHHVSFGFGIHRCMGNRLAEMQIRILWEEILQRFSQIEMVREPTRIQSNFVMGYSDLQVKLHKK